MTGVSRGCDSPVPNTHQHPRAHLPQRAAEPGPDLLNVHHIRGDRGIGQLRRRPRQDQPRPSRRSPTPRAPADPAGVRAFALIPKRVWVPAYDADRDIRDGAWVAELTGLLPLIGWPVGMRVIARKERPHPGAKLRITDTDGMRVTAFATNTTVMDVMPTSA